MSWYFMNSIKCCVLLTKCPWLLGEKTDHKIKQILVTYSWNKVRIYCKKALFLFHQTTKHFSCKLQQHFTNSRHLCLWLMMVVLETKLTVRFYLFLQFTNSNPSYSLTILFIVCERKNNLGPLPGKFVTVPVYLILALCQLVFLSLLIKQSNKIMVLVLTGAGL